MLAHKCDRCGHTARATLHTYIGGNNEHVAHVPLPLGWTRFERCLAPVHGSALEYADLCYECSKEVTKKKEVGD